MEKDNEVKGVGNSLDFGARIYDSRLGRWLSVDPEIANMPWSSSYVLSSNSPIWRIDPDGEWDVEIHTYSNRLKMSYGILILKDIDGNEVARYVVRVAGSAGVGKNYSGSDSRTKTNGDTPTGTYKIDANPWWKNSKEQKGAYGNTYRLAMTGIEGEIMRGSKERQNTIRGHAGRQEIGQAGNFDPNNMLKYTNGCFRKYQEDLDEMRQLTLELEKNNPNEKGDFLYIVDDLVESNGIYYTPSDYKSLINSKQKLKEIDKWKSILGKNLTDKMTGETKEEMNSIEQKGLNPQEHKK